MKNNRTLQQSNRKPVSSGFKQGVAFKCFVSCIGFNFKHEYAKMSQRADNVKLTILEAIVKRLPRDNTLLPSESLKSLLLEKKGRLGVQL